MSDDRSQRGPIWDVAAWSALGFGVAMPFVRDRAQLQNVFSGGNIDNLSRSLGRLGHYSNFNTLTNVRNASEINVRPYLSSFAKTNASALKHDIFSFAYEASMVGRKASADDIRSALNPILQEPDPTKSFNFAMTKIQELGGDVNLLQRRITERADMGSFMYSSAAQSSFLQSTMASPIADTLKSYRSTSLFDIKKMDPFAYQQAMKFEELFMSTGGLEDMGGPSPIKYYNVSDTIGGKQITTPIASIRMGKGELNVPLTKKAPFVYGGEHFTNRFVPRKTYTQEGEILSFAEGVYEKLKRAPQINEKTISAIGANIIDETKSNKIWTMPESVMSAGGRARARMILNEAVSFSDMDEEDIIKLLGPGSSWSDPGPVMKGSLYPYTSGSTAAKGTLTTSNIARDLYGPQGAFVSAEQGVTKFIRQEWSVTQPAKDLAVNKRIKGGVGQRMSRLKPLLTGPKYEQLMYGKYDYTSSKAYSSPQLRTFYAKTIGDRFASDELNRFIGLEEGIIGRDVKDILQYERIVHKDIDISDSMRVNKDIYGQLSSTKTIGKVITPAKPIGMGSEFLGIEKATGRELFTRKDIGSTAVTGMELIDEKTARLYMREQFKMEDIGLAKIFSEENKYVMGLERQGELRSALSAAKAPIGALKGKDIESLVADKVLKRNKMALINQQVEAMYDIASDKVYDKSMTARGRVAAKEFLEDPSGYLNIGKLIKEENLNKSFMDVESRLVGFAKKMRFSQQELGLTFGLMDQGVANSLRIGQAVADSQGVIGMSKMNIGALVTEGGAGGFGSIEQTGIRALTMKGPEGVMAADDIVNRIIDKQGIRESDTMMSTMLGLTGDNKNITESLTDIADESLIQKQGRYINLGQRLKELGGSSQIYIPGLEKSPSLVSPFRAKSGEVMDTDLVKSIKNLKETLSSGDSSKAEDAARQLRETAFAASERTAAPRGKVLGSRFLTATRRSYVDDDVVRVSTREARGMYDDLIERASDNKQKEFLLKERERMLGSVDEIGYGTLWRHPTTGPESLQFSKFRVDPKLASGTIAVPGRTGILAIQKGKEIIKDTIDISQMAGMKGDFDDDKLALSIISDKGTVSRIKTKIDNELSQDYNKYLFTHNALKKEVTSRRVKESSEALSEKSMLVSGHRKNTVANTTTGRINLALQKIKMGLQANKPEEYRPLAEALFHIEETSIGGKHGDFGKQIYEDVVSAVETGGPKGKEKMAGVMEALFGPKREVKGSVLVGGKTTTSSLLIDPKSWAESAISASDMSRTETSAAVVSARVAKGKKDLTKMPLEEMQKTYNLRRQAQVDASQRLIQEKADNVVKDRGVKAMQTAKRAKNVIGDIASKNKTSIGMGLAAAAAVMAFAPSISGSISPEGPQGGQAATPDTLGSPIPIQQAGLGESPKVYDASSIEHTKRANIRMQMDDYHNSRENIREDARNLSQYGNVRIRTVDDRSLSDPFSMARKIDERL